ncbi:NUDIX domain-containing protein [Picosynechococcus sp. PCC 7117]|uniref:NUDIX domain-containing protein n=1 Tax=Picosynechococcus sp. PCC 7117 TaxID=195498 RepID=UPI0008103C12|nr:NUDIX domain-containing protein [Picosynechococcus sp. PCC 7117]ANV87905.1 hypothetical protein AWQ22_10775 [Picosynechococcus sp. PCC 7117]
MFYLTKLGCQEFEKIINQTISKNPEDINNREGFCNDLEEKLREEFDIKKGASSFTLNKFLFNGGYVNEYVAKALAKKYSLELKQHFFHKQDSLDLKNNPFVLKVEEEIYDNNPSEEDVRTKGEIRILYDETKESKEEKIFAEDRIELINKYVCIKRDNVLRKMENGEIQELSYVSIIYPGSYYVEKACSKDGAVTLPIDFEAGKVLLVSEYRHVQRHRLERVTMTEVPRGFREPQDKNSRNTSTREMREETPTKSETIKEEDLIFLKKVVPDSGKLCDTVDLYLLETSQENIDNNQTILRVSILDCFWVDIEKFYASIVNKKPIKIDSYFAEQKQEIDLYIECSFTIQVAFLALPEIFKKLYDLNKRDLITGLRLVLGLR